MIAAGLDPVGIRASMRIEMMKQAVLEGEVDSKLFFSYGADELHKYFDAHQASFLKPESIELSEIFLGLAGKQEADVKAQAAKLVAQLRGGADFCTLATAYTERQASGGQKPCKVGLFPIPELRPHAARAVKNVKPGGVSEPLKTDEGYQILHVDARTAASNTPPFNHTNGRAAPTPEPSPKPLH